MAIKSKGLKPKAKHGAEREYQDKKKAIVDAGRAGSDAGPNFLRGKTVQRMQAKALFLEKGGKISIPAIAKVVGVYSDTVQRWKVDDNWNDELRLHFTNAGIKQAAGLLTIPEVKSLCGATDEELVNAVNALVGGKVGDIVAGFMTRIHQQDIRDLDTLNQAIRTKLALGVTGLKTVDISNLVTSKVNIIKAFRLIFGQSTESVDNNNDNKSITLIMPADAANALNRLSAFEAEYEQEEIEYAGMSQAND